jgi:Na+/H+ antiporter NhaC
MNTLSIALLPVTFFIASLICAIFTGSSWGTFALMLSIAIPMITSLLQFTTPVTPELIPILFPTIGAIFSGGVCGDHISPISETTIMTATSTGTSPIDHTYTQFPYALPAIIGTIVAFIVSGHVIHLPHWINALVSFGSGLGICLSLLVIFNFLWRK